MATAFLFSIVAGTASIRHHLAGPLHRGAAPDTPGEAVAHSLDARTRDADRGRRGSDGVRRAGHRHFRGFQHFGIIGGSGMVLCWLATYGVMPAIIALLERVRLRRHQRERRARTEASVHALRGAVRVGRAPGRRARRWRHAGCRRPLACRRRPLPVAGALEYNVRKLRATPTRPARSTACRTSGQPHPGGQRLGRHDRADRRPRDTPLVAAELRRCATARRQTCARSRRSTRSMTWCRPTSRSGWNGCASSRGA